MKILIATGVYPPDIGGPAEYAFQLNQEFKKLGYEVTVISYHLEKSLPWGIRQLWYFFRVLRHGWSADFFVAFDTLSTGAPAVFVSFIFGKKIIVRIGGDFLWESFVERSGVPVPLSEFYKIGWNLSLKEKIIRQLQQFLLDYSDGLVFNSEWQKDIWAAFYNVNPEKIEIIENFYGQKENLPAAAQKVFLFAARPIKLKNFETLELAFNEARKGRADILLEAGSFDRETFSKKLKECYAVILPSFSDVSPNFIIRALTAGRPFIMTRDTGLRQKLDGLGIFVNPMSIDEIKTAILALADDENYLKFKQRIAGFKYTHSWRQIAEEFLKVFAKLK